MGRVRSHLSSALMSTVFTLCACGDAPAPAADPRAAVELSLRLPDGTVLERVDYVISGALLLPNRTGTIVLTGSPDRLRFQVGSLPIGSDYQLSLSASTTAGGSCAGSARFNVVDAGVTPVNIGLTCRSGGGDEQDTAGDVRVNVAATTGGQTVCPVITGVSALPSAAVVGQRIELQAFLSSEDPDAQVRWASGAGTLSSPSALATSLTCERGGSFAVETTVDKPGCPARTWSMEVACERLPVGDDFLINIRPCVECARSRCTADVDFFNPCVNATPTDFAVVDANFSRRCSDAFQCSISTGCAQTPDSLAACYCGATSCEVPQGPCGAEWAEAAGCASGSAVECVDEALIDLSKPLAVANFLTQCALAQCASVCARP